ncbi:MAG: hypothetical protein IT574_06675 [Candidatus Aureabacteria bacterium]|nr:hypothetical protein [Candidatus Auribacterota bacterium]NLW93305.1 hypothetical protein [Chlamydiota bacterium]HOE26323.1 hypothetical protein [bacterium]HQM53437.1 hypothetical protein [bacterium]
MKDRNALKRLLLGLGFDCRDGLWRVTRGKNFRLYGGSEETHGEMQEKAIKLNEQLEKRKKTLDTVSIDELAEIARTLDLFKER